MDSDLYRSVVETMSDGVAVQDAESRLIYVNPALSDLLGYSQEELVGRPSHELVAASWRPGYLQQQLSRRNGSAQPYETHAISKSGIDIPVLVSPRPLFDAVGAYQGSFAVVIDIRNRRRTEIEREVISEIVRGVVVTANLDELLHLIHDSLKRVIYAENCFVALLDDQREMIHFPYFVDLVDPVQPPIKRGKTCTDYVLRTGLPLLLTKDRFRHLVDKGEVELVGSNSPSWMGVPLMTPTRTIGVLAVQHYEDEGAFSARDLEFFGSVGGHIALAIERKRAEEKLHASQELHSSVVESMSDGVLVLDRDFHFLGWNRAMERISKMPRETVLQNGQLPWELLPHLRDLGIDRMMRRAMAGHSQQGTDLRHELQDGTLRITNETYRPLRGAEGEIRGVVGVVRDITDRKRAEEALQKSEEQLRQAQKMEAIGRLAGGIAHDFNNLLTAINGHSELILDHLGAKDPLRSQIGEIRQAGEHGAELTRQLLAFSRKQVIKPKVVDLNRQIEELESMLRRLIGEDIELVTDPERPLDRVKTDPGQIEQVLINLVVNARDAMPQGGTLTIRTANRFLDDSCADHAVVAGPYVGLEVSDTGSGIAPEIQGRIFEPFFTTKEKAKGTGMGLSTVYGIVKQNGGYVWVKSSPGEGATFQVYLPRTQEPLSVLSGASASEDGLRGSETVLVVEDEASVRALTGMILERNGYRVLEAAEPDEALRLFASLDAPLDLLVSDVVMPRMSGPQLAARLKQRQQTMKTLFISGHPDETVLQQGMLSADTELLVKPFKVRDLLSRVRRILDEPLNRVG